MTDLRPITPVIRVALVEDEPLARQALRGLIADDPGLELAGEAAHGDEAIALLRATQPELVFLDVGLPGRSGIDVLRATGTDATVIFATAFDNFALVAFELGAIDYLTKPFDRERFMRAVARALPQIEARRSQRKTGVTVAQAPAAADSIAQRLAGVSASTQPPQAIYVRERGTVLPIPTSEIVRLEADGDFVAVVARGKRYLLYVNLGDLCIRLGGAHFLRVHRSHAINLALVRELKSADGGRVEICMRDRSRIIASRAGSRAIRSRVRDHGPVTRTAPPIRRRGV